MYNIKGGDCKEKCYHRTQRNLGNDMVDCKMIIIADKRKKTTYMHVPIDIHTHICMYVYIICTHVLYIICVRVCV